MQAKHLVGRFTTTAYDQVVFLGVRRLLVADYKSGTPPLVAAYREYSGQSALLDGWDDDNDECLVGDFMGNGHDQLMLFNQTNQGNGRIMIVDFWGGSPPGVVRYWENWGQSPLFDGWQDANDDRLVGDFLGLGYEQVMFFNRTNGGDGRVMVADFKGGSPPAVVRYWENWGQSPLLDGWQDVNDDRLVGDFLGLGYDQVMFFNRTNGGDGRVMVADFKGGSPPATVRYWENWGQSPLLDGWQDANDDRLVGDFLGLGYDQVMFFNRTNASDGRVMVADFRAGGPPAAVRYWEQWEDSPLLNGWQDREDASLVGDFAGLGHAQVMFRNVFTDNEGRVLVADFASGSPPAVVRYWEPWIGRHLNADEKGRFRAYFPPLDVNRCRVTGGDTPTYNCVSWTVGVTNQWLWPGTRLADFDIFYQAYGFVRDSYGEVAAWGRSDTDMTHASVRESSATDEFCWESKCGADLRIVHVEDQLRSDSYGHIIAFYRRTRVHLFERKPVMIVLTTNQRRLLRAAVDSCPQKLKEEFQRRYARWAEAIEKDPQVRISSNPMAVTRVKEFQELVGLGEPILPLIIDKLVDPSNFRALQVYEALAHRGEALKETIATDQQTASEQARAERAVERWLERHRTR